MTSNTRVRVSYLLVAFAIVALGLLWRSQFLSLSPFLRKYGGDAWWAALVFVLIRFIRPTLSTIKTAFLAFGISLAVELSQLYHAPWIDEIRSVRVAALVLGSTFNWPDIPAYAVGIIAAATIDRICKAA